MTDTNEKKIDWHKIYQDFIDDSKNLETLSGKEVLSKSREYQMMMRADFVCFAGKKIEGSDKIIRPFSHFKTFNVIELKSINETINKDIFRHYCSRAMGLELDGSTSYCGDTTLTIVTTRKPIAVLKHKTYKFEEIAPWKYKCNWIEDLDIYILIQNQMRDLQEGEAMALLQVLEGDKNKQKTTWQNVLRQDLQNIEQIKKIINTISGGSFMNVIAEAETKGKIEGKIEVAIEMLKEGFEVSLVAKLSKLSEEEVQKLKEQL